MGAEEAGPKPASKPAPSRRDAHVTTPLASAASAKTRASTDSAPKVGAARLDVFFRLTTSKTGIANPYHPFGDWYGEWFSGVGMNFLCQCLLMRLLIFWRNILEHILSQISNTGPWVVGPEYLVVFFLSYLPKRCTACTDFHGTIYRMVCIRVERNIATSSASTSHS